MYTVLKNNTPIINAADMQTAIYYVQSLERELIRGLQHSPYTIVKADVADNSTPVAQDAQTISC